MQDKPTERPAPPDPDTDALATVQAHVELRETLGGRYITAALAEFRDNLARQTLDNERLDKRERRDMHAGYRTVRDFIIELDADFQAALLHLQAANKLPAALAHYITAKSEPEPEPETNHESANVFGGMQRQDEPEQPATTNTQP